MRLVVRFPVMALVVAVVATVVTIGTASGATRSITSAPVADATIRADRPTRTYGTTTGLTVDNSPVQNTLMRFVVSGVGADAVTHASLRLFVTNPSPVAGTVYAVSSQTWTESVTWATAPPADFLPISTVNGAALNTWVDFDVTSLIRGDGTYSVRITSSSNDGATYTSREGTSTQRPQLVVTATTTADTTNPTASITAPVSGATVSGQTPIAVDAFDNIGVTSVDVAVDGTVIGTDTTAPYGVTWDTTTMPNGSHQLTATAHDGAGNIGNAAAVGVTVANVVDVLPPSPPAGLVATVVEPTRVGLAWEASTDDVGVTSYEIQRDASTIGTSTTTGFTDTTVPAGSTVTYTIVALDLAGHRSDPSAPATVTTPSPPTSFTFAAAGDHGANVSTAASLAALDASPAEFYLALGDLDYNETVTDAAWCDYVHANMPIKGSSFPYEVVSGNHESDGATDGSILNHAACLPDKLGSTPGPGSVYGAEYSFDYPTGAPLARFIMISPELTVGGQSYHYVAGNPHYTWLASTIDAARAAGIQWIVVGMHFPCLTAGSYQCGADPALMNLLIDKRVDLILHGHEHTYQRSKQLALDPATCPVIARDGYTPGCVVDDGMDGVYPKGAGSVDVIAGTFGKGLYNVSRTDPEAPYFVTLDGTTHGFMQYTVTASHLDATFVKSDGSLTDSFSIVAGVAAFADRSPPSQPTNLQAGTAVPGRVDLSWTGSVDDAAIRNYAVLRDGIPIGTSTTTTYSDTSVVVGQAHSYTVQAFDAAWNASLVSSAVLVGVPVAPTLTFAPDADATLRFASPTTNFGAATSLEVDSSSLKDFLLRFTVSGVGTGTVTSAKLRLTCVDSSPRGGDFTVAASNLWTESTVTWNTAPAAGAPAASLFQVAAGTTYDVDLTSLIHGDGTYTLRVTSPNADGADYASKEGVLTSRPQLILTTSSP